METKSRLSTFHQFKSLTFPLLGKRLSLIKMTAASTSLESAVMKRLKFDSKDPRFIKNYNDEILQTGLKERSYPIALTPSNDLIPKTLTELQGFDKLSAPYTFSDFDTNYSDEPAELSFEINICRFFEECYTSEGVLGPTESAQDDFVEGMQSLEKVRFCEALPIAQCSHMMYDNSGVFGVVELVPSDITKNMPDQASSVSDKYSRKSYDPEDEYWCRAVGVLFGSMVDQRSPYGVLTSLDRTWFFKLNEVESLLVSDCIWCDRGVNKEECPALSCWVYFMRQARTDCEQYGHCLPDKKRGSLESGRKRKATEEKEEIEAVPIHSFHVSAILGSGRSGAVYQGSWQGEGVAVKLASMVKQPRDSQWTASQLTSQVFPLDKERQRYHQLQGLQGSCIPRLVVEQVSSNGLLSGFAMELLAPMDRDFEEWTDDEKEAAVVAVTRLAEAGGMLQHDFTFSNFAIRAEDETMAVVDLENLIDLSDLNGHDAVKRLQKCVRTINARG